MLDRHPKLAIVGAGPSGLAAAHHLADTHQIWLFDSHDSTGGVWADTSTQAYSWLETNTPTALFPYPGFPLQSDDYESTLGKGEWKGKAYVSGRTAKRYYTRFAKQNHIDDSDSGRLTCLKLGCKVVSLARPDPVDNVSSTTVTGWMLQYLDLKSKIQHTVHFDKVIFATGAFSVPAHPDQLRISISSCDSIFHSYDMGSSKFEKRLISAQKIIIIGGGKSALDLIARVSTLPSDHRPHILLLLIPRHQPSAWPVAPGRIPSYLSRMPLLGATYLSPWTNTPQSPQFWSGNSRLVRRIRRLYWSSLARQIYTSYPPLFPSHSLEDWREVLRSTSRLFPAPPGLELRGEKGGIEILRATLGNISINEVKDSSSLTLTLDDGTVRTETIDMKKDLLVACTGYQTSASIIAALFTSADKASEMGIPVPEALDVDQDESNWRVQVEQEILACRQRDVILSELFDQDEYRTQDLNSFKLYHHMIPIDQAYNNVKVDEKQRDFAVMGLPQTLSAAIVADVQARWLAQYFNGSKSDGKDSLPFPKSRKEASQKTARLIAASYSRYGPKDARQGTTMSLELAWYADLLLSDIKSTKQKHAQRRQPSNSYWYPFRAQCSDDFL